MCTGAFICPNPELRHSVCAALCIEFASPLLHESCLVVRRASVCARSAKYISSLLLRGWAQGADWIQSPAVDTDQQKQLSEKLPSALPSLRLCIPLSLNSSPSLSLPPLFSAAPFPLKWGDLWSGDSFLSKSEPRIRWGGGEERGVSVKGAQERGKKKERNKCWLGSFTHLRWTLFSAVRKMRGEGEEREKMKGFNWRKKGKLGHVGKIKGTALLALIAPPHLLMSRSMKAITDIKTAVASSTSAQTLWN